MTQWLYFSLRLQDNQLMGFNHGTKGVEYVDWPYDIDVDNNDLNFTLRRWNAILGENGWELVNILPDIHGQEWVYKKPVTR